MLFGVGKKQQERLAQLELVTVGDLVFNFPRRYEDFSSTVAIRDLKEGLKQTVRGSLWQVREVNSRRGLRMLTATLIDGTGVVKLTWFNQSYLKDSLVDGAEIIVSGQVTRYREALTYTNPAFELVKTDADNPDVVHVGRIVPIYAETAGITSKWLRRVIHTALPLIEDQIVDRLPEALRREQNLMDTATAVRQMHFPDDQKLLNAARRRFGFEELFYWQLKSLLTKKAWQDQGKAMTFTIDKDILRRFTDQLPFALTNAQKRAIRELLLDMEKPMPMARLLEGDVGAGKTLVAAMGLVNAVANGAQAALMAPTEILAEQHFQGLSRLLASFDFTVGLLTSGKCLVAGRDTQLSLLGMREEGEAAGVRVTRAQSLQLLTEGKIHLVIGTHSLIQRDVHFHNLGFVVIDEQHRFGVQQRTELAQKSGNPDLLVMTATPIPRSLALRPVPASSVCPLPPPDVMP